MIKATVPFVIEKRSDGERTYDIYSRLLEDRIIFLGEEIDVDVANTIVAQLLLLDQRNPHLEICLYINSPGGSVTSGMAIYDTMQLIRCDVRTVCIGMAASMAAELLAAGTKGKRCALPNSRIMIHQPRSGGAGGTVTEQEIELKLIKDMKLQGAKILSHHTGRSVKQVLKDIECDNWMKPEAAIKYGLIDEILEKRPA